MSEPILTLPNPTGTGRPIISEDQFQIWLDDMREFLRRGHTLNYAMEKSGILAHETVIREKYAKNDWFARKVDALRATIGEMVADVAFRTVEAVRNRLIDTDGKLTPTSEETQIIKLVAEKHRAAQPFFVTRIEQTEADPEELGKIIEPKPLEITYVVPINTTAQPQEAVITSENGQPAPATNQVSPDNQAAPSVATADQSA